VASRFLALILLFAPLAVAATSPDQIIYHINSKRSDVQWKAISNLENLYLGTTDSSIEVVVLLQGEAIDLIAEVNQNRDLGLRLEELRQLGMRIEVGRDNYLQHQSQMATSDPPSLVDNIFTRIIELQQQGYLYLTP
jgi:intracellular sulfur oxidation DsrE/DsrF family protein